MRDSRAARDTRATRAMPSDRRAAAASASSPDCVERSEVAFSSSSANSPPDSGSGPAENADRALVCEIAALRTEARGADSRRAPAAASSSDDEGVGTSDALADTALARAALLRGAVDAVEPRRATSATSSAAKEPPLVREAVVAAEARGAMRSPRLPQFAAEAVGNSGAFSSLSRIRWPERTADGVWEPVLRDGDSTAAAGTAAGSTSASPLPASLAARSSACSACCVTRARRAAAAALDSPSESSDSDEENRGAARRS